MKMPMGKFKGQPVESMTSAYLHWLVCNDAIRFKRWPLVKEALRVLRDRLNNFDTALEELKVVTPPPRRWVTPEERAVREKERAAKLRKLEAERAERRKHRREEWHAECQQREAARLSAHSGQIVDAAAFVRQSRKAANAPDAMLERIRAARARRLDPNDVSDLI